MRPSDEHMPWFEGVCFKRLAFQTKLHNLKYIDPEFWFSLEVQARREVD